MADWKFAYEGEVYRFVDLTLDEIEQLHVSTGLNWDELTRPLVSPSAAWTILGALHARRTGRTVDEVVAVVKQLTTRQLLETYSIDDGLPTGYADGFPPVADGTLTDS
jgi:hypothetical protein